MAGSPIAGDRSSATSFRRASSQFTSVPQRSLSLHEKAGLARDDAAAEVLYVHPNVKIYTFQPPTDALKNLDKSQKTLPDADYPIDAIEILPWRARTELLSSKGGLLIEKVRGSVHFLKAGNLIHTIMKNSQCWCVDGESKFVMRVGKLKYQRIEFPAAEPEEKQKVEEFKEVISKILKFEKTPCPFIRAFHVDLPEDAITPRRRGTWKRRESQTPITPDDESPFPRRTKTARAMSMRGMPPSSFPSRSMTQADMERPRTASNSTASTRFSFPETRTESPTSYASGGEYTDSDRHDSESDRPESSQHSEIDDSDKEISKVTTLKSPLKIVTNLSPTKKRASAAVFPNVKETAAKLERRLSHTYRILGPSPQPKPTPKPKRNPVNAHHDEDLVTDNDDPLFATLLSETRQELPVNGSATHHLSPHSTHDNNENVPSMNGAPVDTNRAKTAIEDSETSSDQSVLSKVPEMHHTSPLAEDAVLNGDKSVEPRANTENPPFERQQSKVDDLVEAAAAVTPRQDGDAIAEARSEYSNIQVRNSPIEESPVSEPTTERPESNTKDMKDDSKACEPNDLPASEENEMRISDTEVKCPPPGVSEVPEVPTAEQDSELVQTRTNDDAESIVSTDSFHTLLSDESRLETGLLPKIKPSQHRRELSELTVVPASSSLLDDQEVIADQDVPVCPEHSSVTTIRMAEATTDQDGSARFSGTAYRDSDVRRRLKHQRSLSPLPPACILEPPTQPEHDSVLSTVLLQVIATIAVVKPVEVVIFVVHILARIAGGATMSDLMSGDLFRRPSATRSTPRTVKNLGGGEPPVGGESDEEDDYGLPVRGRRRSSTAQSGNRSDIVTRHGVDANSSVCID